MSLLELLKKCRKYVREVSETTFYTEMNCTDYDLLDELDRAIDLTIEYMKITKRT